MQAPPSPNNVGPQPHQQTAAYRQKLLGAQDIEATRQALLHGEANSKTLAYARFLSAVENDATYDTRKCAFHAFQHADIEVARAFPALALFIKHRIETAFEHPPIPTPPFWRAWSDSLGADASPYGEGATEQEAIDDLLIKLEDMR